MPKALQPLPRPILSIHHHRVHIIHRAVVLSGPFVVIQRLVCGMPGVETAALPLADELCRLHWWELVINRGDGGLVDVTFEFGEFGELLLGSADVWYQYTLTSPSELVLG